MENNTATETPGQGTVNPPASDSHRQPPAVHPVDEVLPVGRTVLAGIQHVAAMYAGVVAPPIIIAAALRFDLAQSAFLVGACLFTAGLATLLQTLGPWKFGARLPFVNGVSFATVTPMTAILAGHGGRGGLPVIYGATIVSGLVCVVAAPWFCRFVKYFPPIVSGSVITLIGVSLLPVAVGWVRSTAADTDRVPGKNLALAGFTLAVILALRRLTRGFLQQVAILVGLLVGTLAAIPMGMAHFSGLAHEAVFGFPTPFHFGAPRFDAAAIVSMLVVMLVCMTESTADMIALGEVVDRPSDETVIARGLRADGLGSALSAVFNGFMCSAFAQNIGLVALTRMRSRFIVAFGGVVLVALGVMPILSGAVALIPQPVLGGAGLVLFGTVAVAGVKMLGTADLGKDSNLLIAATALGLGIIPVVGGNIYAGLPSWLTTILGSGISTGCVAAVVLNLLFHHIAPRRHPEP
ncbi:uracil permease [Mangrovactinospora gilvigrisea]|uniref:Uracil permease n=1 Tax=Mangrovactinospora gilvigrisea TaxID=1428644 RepID=A0A1J7C850_9ACTN|nr:nucleobase:cation symporter-2 family protein [Mangrovactinospora gilvigrisea]OIV37700.1 uracil permease [Mangrovactinospora gilvigrisea]